MTALVEGAISRFNIVDGVMTHVHQSQKGDKRLFDAHESNLQDRHPCTGNDIGLALMGPLPKFNHISP
jgi:hypothetical protein